MVEITAGDLVGIVFIASDTLAEHVLVDNLMNYGIINPIFLYLLKIFINIKNNIY